MKADRHSSISPRQRTRWLAAVQAQLRSQRCARRIPPYLQSG
ncbi:hypothetical protein RHECNPAF_930085 [Rhizobium etli CNPAF512]|nr:hypothetical protein RHECNPAF_930085 [Rhizobium etli CNPAF512]